MKKCAMALILCFLLLVMTACGGIVPNIGAQSTADITADASKPADAVVEGKATSYAEAYTQLTSIQEAVTALMEELNAKHNGGLSEDDPNNTSMVMYGLMLMSLDLAFTATFSEDPNMEQGVEIAMGMLGGKDVNVIRVAVNDYKITYTNNEGVACELNGTFDPGTGSLRSIGKENGEENGLYEFINLGEGRFAYQTNNERAVVVYRDNAVQSFVYSAKDSQEPAYTSAADSIFPDGSGADEAWVTKEGADNYPQVYTFEEGVLKMEATPMMGDKLSVEISK